MSQTKQCWFIYARPIISTYMYISHRSNLKSGLEKGGSFAAYYQGRLVANLWGGHSDYDCRRPWKEDTLSTFFSSTKAIAAFVIAHLVDRFVQYNAP